LILVRKIAEIETEAESRDANKRPPKPASAQTASATRLNAGKMLFMVIERFDNNDMVPVYQRLRDGGRGLPDGLEFVESWVEANFRRCFQLMRCSDPRAFQEWQLCFMRMLFGLGSWR
jgi:hypothetical protein